jgi:hypothetical protein
LIRDRTTQSFAAFLDWVKSHLRRRATDDDADPTLGAFVVDRHDGQLAALRVVFPESRIVFCSKHLGENVKQVMGHASKRIGSRRF